MADDEFAGADWIDANWEKLLAERRHNHEWVAVDGERIVSHDPRLDRAIALARDEGREIADLTFAYLNYDIRVRL